MSGEAYGYRIGAVQTLQGYDTCPEFSLPILKKALKKIKKDYPGQKIRFGMFNADKRIILAIQPERPTPPDQWMIIAPVVAK